MPSVAVTGGDALGARGAAVDGQMQGHRAVAAHGIGCLVSGCIGGSGVGGAVPGVAVASSHCLSRGGTVVNG